MRRFWDQDDAKLSDISGLTGPEVITRPEEWLGRVEEDKDRRVGQRRS